MRIESIQVDGFGKLANVHFELAPGLNLFFGENETGKSTLQQAILALLYGFYSASRASPKETARLESFRPWLGGAYRASLQYVLAKGERFLVERDFNSTDIPTRVLELPTGRDVTGRFGHGPHGIVPFAMHHLGLTKEVFQGSAFVDQGQLAALGDSAAWISETLVSLADTGKPDTSATRAIASLEDLIKTRIGTERARTTPLAQARRRLQEAKEQLARLDDARKQVAQAASRKQTLEDQLARTRAELKKLDLLIIFAQLADLQGRLSKLVKLEERLQKLEEQRSDLQPYAAFPSHLYENVVRLRGALQQARVQLTQLEERAPSEQEMKDVERSIQDIYNDISDLEFVRAIPADLEVQVRSLEREWRSVRASLLTLERNRQRQRRYASLALVAGLAIFALAWFLPTNWQPWGPLLGAVLAVVSGVAWWRMRLPAASATASLQLRLFTIIRSAGVAQEDPEGALASFYDRAQKRQRLTMLEAELNTLNEKQDGLRERLRQFEDKRKEVEGLEGDLHRFYGEAGIRDTDLSRAWSTFDESCGKKTEYDGVLREIESTQREKEALVGGKTRMQLSAEINELKTSQDTILANNPDLREILPKAATGAPTKEREEQDKLRQELELEIARLDTQIVEGVKGHRPRAEIEEDIARYQREVQSLENTRKALEIARETVKQAAEEARRDFAPGLNRELGSALGKVTENRYKEVHIDPATFGVTATIPETGRLEPINKVSYGTQDLVWFHLRLTLAQLMSSLHEPIPVILDDCLVNLDSPRLERVLAFLADYSADHQVLLFSKDEKIRDSFGERPSHDDSHRMHILS